MYWQHEQTSSYSQKLCVSYHVRALTKCANQGVHRHNKSANMYMHWQSEQLQTSRC